MINTWAALLKSRKFWSATIAALSIVGAVVLRALGKIPADALTPTITGIAALGGTLIAGIAWEDGNKQPPAAAPPPAGGAS